MCSVKTRVKCSDFVVSTVMEVPWFIVVMRRRSESPHDAYKVMLVFESDVLVDDVEASCHPINNIHSGHDYSASFFPSCLKTPGTLSNGLAEASYNVPQQG